MREDVKRDNMWSEEAEDAKNADETAMQDQMQDLDDYATRLEGELEDSVGPEEWSAVLQVGPTEAELVTIALLMRLYDLQLALLSHFDRARADEVYEAHAEGKNFNPTVFIPKMGEADEQS